jgi:hypothetical protein
VAKKWIKKKKENRIKSRKEYLKNMPKPSPGDSFFQAKNWRPKDVIEDEWIREEKKKEAQAEADKRRNLWGWSGKTQKLTGSQKGKAVFENEKKAKKKSKKKSKKK